ncbi:hypothetical protein ACULLL_09265 [Lysinibacillus irui]|uniref:hypothetical protein n=1 Tax=Lysinibacillus irui TaxID=2998077 RepID=UPI0040443B81
MVVQRTVNGIGSSLNVSITQLHIFNQNEIAKYKKIFTQYKLKNLIITNSFEESNWILKDFIGNKRNIDFNLGKLNYFSDALKCFTLINVSSNFSIGHIAYVQSVLKKIILITEGFQEEGLVDYEEYLYSLSFATRIRPVYYSKQFLQFIEHKNKNIYDINIGSSNEIMKKNRDLPNYELIIDFHYMLRDFEFNAEGNEKMKFYPIILWWKITGLIPLRPKELCLLEFNCTFKKNDQYFIKLPRKKQKANSTSELSIDDTVRINKEIYDAIEDYKKTVPVEYRSEYLFSYLNQSRYTKVKNSYKRRKDLLPTDIFDWLLKQFYREVLGWNKSDFIKIKENDKVYRNYITPGDTRHFSMSNLMLQGVNPLSIAKMAGHVRIGTQRNYWGHMEHFVESFVYILTSKNRMTQLDNKLNNGIFNFQDKIDESKILEISDFEKLHEVEHGYCRNNNFPEECPGECRFCEYYFFKPKNYQGGIKWLQNQSDLLEQQLMTETRSLLAIFKNMKFNLITETYSILDQEMALSNANVINRLIRQKAMVDSLLPRKR